MGGGISNTLFQERPPLFLWRCVYGNVPVPAFIAVLCFALVVDLQAAPIVVLSKGIELDDVVSKEASVSGLSLKFSIGKKLFEKGERIPILLVFTNISERILYLSFKECRDRKQEPYPFVDSRPDKTFISLIIEGNEAHGIDFHNLGLHSYLPSTSYEKLLPAQIIKKRIEIGEPGRVFFKGISRTGDESELGLIRPGKYRIRAIYQVKEMGEPLGGVSIWEGRIETPFIEIDVIGK